MILSLKSMEEFEDIRLPSADGEEVRLGDLWQDQALVMVWLRHYG